MAAEAEVTETVATVPAAVIGQLVVKGPFDEEVFRLMVTPDDCEVKAVMRTLFPFIRRSCTVDNSLETSEVEESVLDTDPMGLRLEDVSSNEVEEWVSPPLED